MITIKISKKNGENCSELEKKLMEFIFASMERNTLFAPAYLISATSEENILLDNLKEEDFIGSYINLFYEE